MKKWCAAKDRTCSAKRIYMLDKAKLKERKRISMIMKMIFDKHGSHGSERDDLRELIDLYITLDS